MLIRMAKPALSIVPMIRSVNSSVPSVAETAGVSLIVVMSAEATPMPSRPHLANDVFSPGDMGQMM
jgi:hypothetical protein